MCSVRTVRGTLAGSEVGPTTGSGRGGSPSWDKGSWGQNPSNEGAGLLVDLLGHRFWEDKALGSLGRAVCRRPGHGWGWC